MYRPTPPKVLLMYLLLNPGQPKPTITHYPQPNLTIDFSPFSEAGCPSAEYGLMECAADSPLAAYDCTVLQEPSNLLGGLDPAYPIATCIIRPYWGESGVGGEPPAEGTYFYNAGGLIPSYIRYVIYRDESFQAIRNADELAAVYAPIDSPDEALSFALAAYDLSAYYNLERNPDYEYVVETLEDTHVEAIEGGYVVHLYHYQVFGCGPHWTSIVDVTVTTEGDLSITNTQQAYKDPSQDNLCVD